MIIPLHMLFSLVRVNIGSLYYLALTCILYELHRKIFWTFGHIEPPHQCVFYTWWWPDSLTVVWMTLLRANSPWDCVNIFLPCIYIIVKWGISAILFYFTWWHIYVDICKFLSVMWVCIYVCGFVCVCVYIHMHLFFVFVDAWICTCVLKSHTFLKNIFFHQLFINFNVFMNKK